MTDILYIYKFTNKQGFLIAIPCLFLLGCIYVMEENSDHKFTRFHVNADNFRLHVCDGRAFLL